MPRSKLCNFGTGHHLHRWFLQKIYTKYRTNRAHSRFQFCWTDQFVSFGSCNQSKYEYYIQQHIYCLNLFNDSNLRNYSNLYLIRFLYRLEISCQLHRSWRFSPGCGGSGQRLRRCSFLFSFSGQIEADH